MSYLLLYSTQDGQTKKIIMRIAENLRRSGVSCDLRDLAAVKQVNLASYQKVMVGASIRYGHFNSVLHKFVTHHQKQLNQKPTAFFGVNLTARKPEKRTPETNAYVRKFLMKSPWQPDLCEVFAGALLYPRYKWLDRVMIQIIMRMTGGETDTTKEIEYTDWAQVDRFSEMFLQI
ncbi:protoporphyrin flavoprotein oxidase [Xenorhabdus nematophila ATCC 19061]|uniref:Protoporphyrinogen IX dehydrogenase [quinone] n=1 Tax=Xenorhabdus nematophila (strain ATCC 19061 / DSM 3370 / CCUG 14189 / LMG 1036 / NCIMB 9965 / AN6) TaxID=406817 RepID=D3VBR0_XENNA|nr:menaquinone-dependent protoporphyrinogen IX dehydrogenase [Xenorhabdus nematophila]CBJ91899.1 protoporphyrin flavoprotein oxidase [Xenorhabdus nematophila ATCC 19061]CEK24716.1 protoporphyrin flavoprotein oxidase [Xenorhabdus nematophila AN6/1]